LNQTTSRNILEHAGKFEFAVVAGAGVKIKRVAAEVRLERGNGYVNPYVEISSRKAMLAFLTSYNFN
jgi:hypothetical protein